MEENYTKPGFVERRMNQMIESAALESYPFNDEDNIIRRNAFKNGALSKAAKEYHTMDMVSQELVRNFIRTNFLSTKWNEYVETVQKDLKSIQLYYDENLNCFGQTPTN